MRELCPALANKAYFNNPALPWARAEKHCSTSGLAC